MTNGEQPIIVCPNCATRVVPMREGICPACSVILPSELLVFQQTDGNATGGELDERISEATGFKPKIVNQPKGKPSPLTIESAFSVVAAFILIPLVGFCVQAYQNQVKRATIKQAKMQVDRIADDLLRAELKTEEDFQRFVQKYIETDPWKTKIEIRFGTRTSELWLHVDLFAKEGHTIVCSAGPDRSQGTQDDISAVGPILQRAGLPGVSHILPDLLRESGEISSSKRQLPEDFANPKFDDPTARRARRGSGQTEGKRRDMN